MSDEPAPPLSPLAACNPGLPVFGSFGLFGFLDQGLRVYTLIDPASCAQCLSTGALELTAAHLLLRNPFGASCQSFSALVGVSIVPAMWVDGHPVPDPLARSCEQIGWWEIPPVGANWTLESYSLPAACCINRASFLCLEFRPEFLCDTEMMFRDSPGCVPNRQYVESPLFGPGLRDACDPVEGLGDWLEVWADAACCTMATPRTTFRDSTLSDVDWPLLTYAGCDDGSTWRDSAAVGTAQANMVFEPSGIHRVIQTDLSAVPGWQHTSLFAVSFAATAIYDPSRGALTSLDYRERAITVEATPSCGGCECQLTGPALRQNGIVYFALDRASQSPPAGQGWSDVHVAALRDTDFCTLPEFASCGAHPDFSENGAPIQFGFYRASSIVPGCSLHVVSGIDDWGVDIRLATADTPPAPAGGEAPLLVLAPNPTHGRLKLALFIAQRAAARVDVVDIAGRRIASRDVSALETGRHTVELELLDGTAPGTYFVRFTQAGRCVSRKVVLVR